MKKTNQIIYKIDSKYSLLLKDSRIFFDNWKKVSRYACHYNLKSNFSSKTIRNEFRTREICLKLNELVCKKNVFIFTLMHCLFKTTI